MADQTKGLTLSRVNLLQRNVKFHHIVIEAKESYFYRTYATVKLIPLKAIIMYSVIRMPVCPCAITHHATIGI